MQVRSNNGQQQRASTAPLHPWQLIGNSDKDYTALVDKWSVNEVHGSEAANRIKLWLASDHNQDLNLSGLELTSLPPLHADLKKLNAANNLLTSLPPQLPPLVELNVRGNQLKRLPEELPTASLQMLNAVGNKLESVPANFHWLRPGCEIYIDGNSLLPEIQVPVGCFLDTDFFYEIIFGSSTKVAVLLAEFPNAASCIGNNGDSPLLHAVQKRDSELVRLLTTHPLTDVNRADELGDTPLFSAIRSGDENLALLILQRPDIDLNKVAYRGSPCLHFAAIFGQKKVVQLMLANPEIDLNQVDAKGQKAIQFVIIKKDLAMFRLFLDCPLLNVDHSFAEGVSIAALIGGVGHVEMLETLLNKVAVNQENQQNVINKAMFSAAQAGKLEIADLLLRKYRCDPDYVDPELGLTVIGIAAENGHIDIVKILLRFHADPMKSLPKGKPALLLSMKEKDRELFELLLALPQMDPNVPDAATGITPLFHAVQNGMTDYMMLLLQHKKIDVNRASHRGLTPLIEACRLGRAAMVKSLLKHQAIDLYVKIEPGISVLDLAAGSGHADIVALLLEAIQADKGMAKVDCLNAVLHAMAGGFVRTTQILMKSLGIKMNDSLANGSTLLNMSSQFGDPKVTQWLLEQGADPGQYDLNGTLPLELAARDMKRTNNMNLIYLLMYGASVKACGDMSQQRSVLYALGRFVINKLTTVSEHMKASASRKQSDATSEADNIAEQSLADARELMNLLSQTKSDVLSIIFAAVALSSIEAYDLTPSEHPLLIQALSFSPVSDPESTASFYAGIRKNMQIWDGQGNDGAGQGTFSVLGVSELSRLPPLTKYIRELWRI